MHGNVGAIVMGWPPDVLTFISWPFAQYTLPASMTKGYPTEAGTSTTGVPPSSPTFIRRPSALLQYTPSGPTAILMMLPQPKAILTGSPPSMATLLISSLVFDQ